MWITELSYQNQIYTSFTTFLTAVLYIAFLVFRKDNVQICTLVLFYKDFFQNLRFLLKGNENTFYRCFWIWFAPPRLLSFCGFLRGVFSCVAACLAAVYDVWLVRLC